ncbi:MAG: IS3 family transposase [Opitutaceae bacterium]|nr:IS3 family transposase [Opitutaceae bacterium]MBP9912064.1 IS3 family transposase [Opitutaceae bacterium]
MVLEGPQDRDRSGDRHPRTRRDAALAVFDYIETFCNPKRCHSSLGQISPVAFGQNYEKSSVPVEPKPETWESARDIQLPRHGFRALSAV